MKRIATNDPTDVLDDFNNRCLWVSKYTHIGLLRINSLANSFTRTDNIDFIVGRVIQCSKQQFAHIGRRCAVHSFQSKFRVIPRLFRKLTCNDFIKCPLKRIFFLDEIPNIRIAFAVDARMERQRPIRALG